MLDTANQSSYMRLKSQKFIVILVFVVTVGLITLFSLSSVVPENSREPPLTLDGKSLDLGVIHKANSLITELPITNVSNTEVRVLRFDTSCVCINILPAEASIQPGETLTFIAKLDLKPKYPYESLSFQRDFEVVITAILDSEENFRLSWRLFGQVAREMIFDPPELEWLVDSDDENRSTRAVRVFVSPVLGACAIQVEGIEHIANISNEADLGPANQFELTLSPILNGMSPVFEAVARVAAMDNDGRTVASLDYSVKGRVLGDVVALPETLILSASDSRAGSILSKSIALVSRKKRIIRKVDILLPLPEDMSIGISGVGSTCVTLDCTLKLMSLDAKITGKVLRFRVEADGQESPLDIEIPIVAVY